MPKYTINGEKVSFDGKIGVLAREPCGRFFALVGFDKHKLDQRKVKAALGIKTGAGRPQTVLGGRLSLSASLDRDTIAKAKEIGQGNISEGIRIAVMKF